MLAYTYYILIKDFKPVINFNAILLTLENWSNLVTIIFRLNSITKWRKTFHIFHQTRSYISPLTILLQFRLFRSCFYHVSCLAVQIRPVDFRAGNGKKLTLCERRKSSGAFHVSIPRNTPLFGSRKKIFSPLCFPFRCVISPASFVSFKGRHSVTSGIFLNYIFLK